MIIAVLTISIADDGNVTVDTIPDFRTLKRDPDDPAWRYAIALHTIVAAIDKKIITATVQEHLHRNAQAPEEPPDHTRPSPGPTSYN